MMFESNSDWYEQAQVVAKFIHKHRAGTDGLGSGQESVLQALIGPISNILPASGTLAKSPVLGRCVPTRRLKGPDDHPPTCSRRGLSPGKSESDADHWSLPRFSRRSVRPVAVTTR